MRQFPIRICPSTDVASVHRHVHCWCLSASNHFHACARAFVLDTRRHLAHTRTVDGKDEPLLWLVLLLQHIIKYHIRNGFRRTREYERRKLHAVVAIAALCIPLGPSTLLSSASASASSSSASSKNILAHIRSRTPSHLSAFWCALFLVHLPCWNRIYPRRGAHIFSDE